MNRMPAVSRRLIVACAVSVAATFSAIPTTAMADTATPADKDAEIAALKAAIAERDAEIAALKGSPNGAPAAPVQPTAAAPQAAALPPGAVVSGQGQAGAGSDQVLRMSPFEVETTQGHGYVATATDNGLKTNQRLIDIPQQVTVITRDMIDDLNYTDTAYVVQYFGLAEDFAGENLKMRGTPIQYPYVDDMPENQAFEDNYFVDSYSIVKGPVQVLYVNASISGTVLKYVKKPLQTSQNIITAQIDSHGANRETVDSTGPIGELGDAKLSYRLVAANQGPGNYFYNIHESHEAIFPELQIDFKNTSVRVSYDFQDIIHVPEFNAFATPSGTLYTGAGPREVNVPPNDLEHHESKRSSVDVLQKVSDNWDMRFEASWWHYHRYGPNVFPSGGYNWATGLETWTARLNNITVDDWTAIGDVTGHYNVWKLPNQDAFGFAVSDWLTRQSLWTVSPFTPTLVPFNSVAAINALQVPTQYQFSPANGGLGVHNETYLDNIYWQHTIDIIPNRLTLVGGWTWAYINTTGVPNINIHPYNANVIPIQTWLHRVGIVAKPIKGVSLYALQSTTFQPPTGVTPVLIDGSIAPPQAGTAHELGFKTDFWGDRISSNFGWFHAQVTNGLVVGGTSPITGQTYYIPVGSTTQEGVDGDIAFTVVPGWQLIGNFYVGHNRDQNGNPVSTSYDNQWSVFTRYEFDRYGPLKGWAIGGGGVRVGGQWVSTAGISGAVFSPYTQATGEMKLQTGTNITAFVSDQFDRHWSFKLTCQNALNEHYIMGYQTAYFVDPSPPITFTLQTAYKF